MEYGYRKQLSGSFTEELKQVRQALGEAGFGILTEIDVKDALKQKLQVEFDNYTILGACNPPLAYEALQAEREIGLLMPCNVIVYERDAIVSVAAIRPTAAMRMVENDRLAQIAEQAEGKLISAIDSL